MTKIEKIKKLATEALSWSGGMNDHIQLALGIIKITEEKEIEIYEQDNGTYIVADGKERYLPDVFDVDETLAIELIK